MSMPEDSNAEVYNKYYPIYAELQNTEDSLNNRVFVQKFIKNKTPHRGCIGPRGFAYEAFYFTEMHWLTLITDALNRIKGLQETLAFYEKNNVARMRNDVMDTLSDMGRVDLIKLL